MRGFIQNTSKHPITLTGDLYVHKPQSFPPKNVETIHFMFQGRLVSRIFEGFQQPAIPNQNSAALWRIFSSHKNERILYEPHAKE
jgi:hypothetical protein